MLMEGEHANGVALLRYFEYERVQGRKRKEVQRREKEDREKERNREECVIG